MDLLGFLKEKKNEISAVTHPFAYKDNYFKYLYCFGLGVLANGHMKAMTETGECFDGILDSIHLYPAYRDRIIIDINNNFDYKINEVFEILDTKEKQYTFCVDLMNLCNITLWAQSYADSVLNIYMKIFKLSNEEKEFLGNFMKVTKRKNYGLANNLYHEFIKKGYRVSYKLLRYICQEFELTEEYNGIILGRGEQKYIDKPSRIKGDIIISEGATLILLGTDIKLEGSILVDGGRLEIKNSLIQAEKCKKDFLIQVKETTLVKIEESEIKCAFQCGFIQQKKGHLLINNTKIMHTKQKPAISFSGLSLRLNGTSLEDCLNGGIAAEGEATARIDDCSFYNCNSEHGGAIYFNSIYEGKISYSLFKNCHAKYLGGAVYYTYKKYQQEVYNCEFQKCTPSDSLIFNHYLEENNIFE